MINQRKTVVNIFAFLVIAVIVGVGKAAPPESIVGGQNAASGEFPYQVSLRLHGQHFCGGSIIGKKYVLTAAHCIAGITSSPYTNVRVITGATSSSWGGTSNSIDNIVIHPGFNTRTTVSPNDIALITLKSELTFDTYTSQINLPSAPTSTGLKAVISGWGFRDTNVKVTAPTLQKATLTTLAPSDCQKYHSYGTLYREQLCGYNVPGIGACQGDSGGPMAVNNEVVGVVSYNIPCALGYPDVFTAVYYYVDWIKRNMK